MKLSEKIRSILNHNNSLLKVYTFGSFEVMRGDRIISAKEWGRDKTIQLFQFLVTSRHRGGLHKEQIMDRLWEDFDDQGFKVALHGINKALEPERKTRQEPKFVVRQGVTYFLNTKEVWIDAEVMEQLVILGNLHIQTDKELAKVAYRQALDLHKGTYLPNRMYEDWSSAERERLQILIIGTYIHLAELVLDDNPQESIRLCQEALSIDNAWEDAYRVQMQAYINMGNRPMAVKTYEKCRIILNEEFGLTPLPVTQQLFHNINAI